MPDNCSAHNCRNKPAGTISKYGDSGYCYPHLMALAEMNANRRPRPVITYFPSFDPKTILEYRTVTPKERLAQISTLSEPLENPWDLAALFE